MVLKTQLQPLMKVFLFWSISMILAALIVSIFSSFVPTYKYNSILEYGFNHQSLEYFRLTMKFYMFMALLIALPGFLINLIIYLSRSKTGQRKMNKIISIVINVAIALIILFIYHSFNISRSIDFYQVIFPAYVISIILFGILVLPGREKK
jgi:hypothetical protein